MKSAAIALALLFASLPCLAVDSEKAAYMGGSLEAVPIKMEGKISTSGDVLVWTPEKGTPIRIPYANMIELEYGQKAGHHLKSAIFLSPIALFKKARHHYVTITYGPGPRATAPAASPTPAASASPTPESTPGATVGSAPSVAPPLADGGQIVLLEFGKGIIRVDLKVIQFRSGLPLHFTDPESEKHFAN
jgi:hypothetical protein